MLVPKLTQSVGTSINLKYLSWLANPVYFGIITVNFFSSYPKIYPCAQIEYHSCSQTDAQRGNKDNKDDTRSVEENGYPK